MKVILFVCALGLAGFVSVAASEKPRFASQPRDGAITIDGRFDDWPGNLQPFEAAPVAVQFLNDKDYLYMRLTASAAAERRQILRQGFTVWFDPAGGTKKHFGIRYPVVERGSAEGGERSGGFGGYGGRRGGERGGGEGGDAVNDPHPGDRIDVLGPGKDDARMLTRDHAPGIDVAIREDQGTLQYELKIPLLKTDEHPYAIEVVAGKAVGVGLESGKSQERFSVGPGGGGFGGGGFGGGIGGRGGGMGGRGGGMRGGGRDRESAGAAKPMKGWGTLTIAAAPAQ
jgi:hypothetical protein